MIVHENKIGVKKQLGSILPGTCFHVSAKIDSDKTSFSISDIFQVTDMVTKAEFTWGMRLQDGHMVQFSDTRDVFVMTVEASIL
jgi:hypothetical protein